MGEAYLRWSNADRAVLKLMENDDTLALNKPYNVESSLPDGLKLFDESNHPIEGASFIDIKQSDSIEYNGTLYRFNSPIEDRPNLQGRLEERKRKSHVLKLLETAQDAFSESGTRKSDRLIKVKAHDNGSKTCFLCASQDKVEASHVFQKSDVSFRQGQELAYNTLETLRDWRDGHKWRRPFEMHGSMNLIWLCHTHNLQFDAHKFCLKIDLQNRALFHAFDNSFDGLVDQANIRLLDPTDDYYDMAYVSRRAIGMRILQSQERSGRYIDHDNLDSWKAIVALSSAASVAARSNDETEESVVSTGQSSQDLDGFDGAAAETAS